MLIAIVLAGGLVSSGALKSTWLDRSALVLPARSSSVGFPPVALVRRHWIPPAAITTPLVTLLAAYRHRGHWFSGPQRSRPTAPLGR